MKRIVILLAAFALAAPAAARQDEASKTLKAQLRTLRLDVDFKNWTVRELVDYIREVAGINVILNPKAAEIPGTVTMKARGVTVHSILRLLLKPLKIGFAVQDGVLMIAPESELKSEILLEIFDVRDLLMPIRDFPGADITLADDGVGATFASATDETPPEFPIVDLVKAHTGGKAWDENPRASIQLNGGLLIVRQTPEVIAQIRKVIGFLRQYK